MAPPPAVRIDLPPESRGVVARRQRARHRHFVLLWGAALLVPLLAMLGAGFASWHAVQAEAEARLGRTVELLRQNALRAFGSQDAIIAAIEHAIAGRSAAELRADAGLQRLLADLTAAAGPLVSGVLVTDGAARIASASWEFPARPADLAARDYVAALADGRRARAVGEAVASMPMGWTVIPIARRAPAAPGRAEAPGLIVSSFSVEALGDFYASVTETPADVVALMREDGAVLARYPAPAATDAPQRPAVAAMVRTLLGTPDRARWMAAPLDGRERLFVARQVGDWPVAVVYGLDRAALRAAWRERMIAPLAGGTAAMLLLGTLTSAAQRAARRQRERAEARAEAEAQLAQAGRAATLGLLAAGIAHEVRNLVQAVRSGSRVIERNAGDPAEVRRCAELLGSTAARGGRLVDAMLAFARGGSEASGSFEVGHALGAMADLLGRTLGSGWQVRAVVPPGLPPAQGDRPGFEGAVVNLAANARDAMPGGGTVTLSAWIEELAAEDAEAGLGPGRYVVVAVHDDGTGMDEATLARLGEPFFTTKPPGIGTGLGLATVRGFCARAGGTLRVESVPGRGTTAAIWLPAA
jgi:two-component system NtrC family sensor kinase